MTLGFCLHLLFDLGAPALEGRGLDLLTCRGRPSTISPLGPPVIMSCGCSWPGLPREGTSGYRHPTSAAPPHQEQPPMGTRTAGPWGLVLIS